MSVVSEIVRIKESVASAYRKCEEKGASLPAVRNSENLAETIERIPAGSSGWRPRSDWWDIDRILEEDTEDFPAKMIVLLCDSCVKTTIYGWGASKIVTSDGVEYESPVANIEHVWDVRKDKACGLGYGTRFVKYYFDDVKITNVLSCTKVPDETLYCVFSHMEIPNPNVFTWSDGVVAQRRLLECVNCVDTIFEIYPCLYGCSSLKEFKNLRYMSLATLTNLFSGVGLERIGEIVPERNNPANGCFNNCRVRVIEEINFNKITNVNGMFSGTIFLVCINRVSNIEISGLSFKDCVLLNHDTLIRILEALYDFSGDLETAHMITLGSTNLAKLTDEELAIGQDKGWTIS